MMTAREAAHLFDVTPGAINYWVMRYGIRGKWSIRRDARGRDYMVKVYADRDLIRAEQRARRGGGRPRLGEKSRVQA